MKKNKDKSQNDRTASFALKTRAHKNKTWRRKTQQTWQTWNHQHKISQFNAVFVLSLFLSRTETCQRILSPLCHGSSSSTSNSPSCKSCLICLAGFCLCFITALYHGSLHSRSPDTSCLHCMPLYFLSLLNTNSNLSPRTWTTKPLEGEATLGVVEVVCCNNEYAPKAGQRLGRISYCVYDFALEDGATSTCFSTCPSAEQWSLLTR